MFFYRLIILMLVSASDIAVAQPPCDHILPSMNEKWDAYQLKPGLVLA